MQTSLFLVPSLEVKKDWDFGYVKQVSSAECDPGSWNRWNPVTATWLVEGGVSHKGFTFFMGHKSYHGVREFNPHTKSYDFFGIRYKKVFE